QFRPYAEPRAPDIVSPPLRRQVQIITDRTAVVEPDPTSETGNVRNFRDLLAQKQWKVFKAAGETGDANDLRNVRQNEGGRLVDCSVVPGQTAFDAQARRKGDAAGQARRPNPPIADVGCAGEAGIVDVVGLDVLPPSIGEAQCDIERPGTWLAMP